MKILFLSLGNKIVASSRTRVFQYIPYLQKNKINTRVIIYNPYVLITNTCLIFRLYLAIIIRLRLLLYLLNVPFYDILFIQKVYLPIWYIKFLKYFRKKIVYDFDDAIYITDKNSAIQEKSYKQLIFTLRQSSLIIVENDFNRDFAARYNKNVLVITGPIECNRYYPSTNRTDKSDLVIGWIGSPATTKYLSFLTSVFSTLAKKYPGLQFVTIGAQGFHLNECNYRNYGWDLKTEVELLHQFDIGIMPLPNDEWSKGKGGYKLLQYMAIGIPSVASPVGANNELILNGQNGFLADKEQDWVNKLSLLIEDANLRKQLGLKARELVESKYSYESYSKIFVNRINSIVYDFN